MKYKLLSTGLLASLTALTAVLSTDATHAYTIQNSTEYYNQLGSKYGLDYDTWNTINAFINGEANGLEDDALIPLNVDDLTWAAGVNNVEVFFVNEGAGGYRNKFLYAVNDSPMQMIFNDVSSPYSIMPNADGPLSLGEGVQLGSFTGNTVLSFFLQNPGGDVFGADPSQNPDGLRHLTVYRANEYLILGYEDITGGGDLDYNDVVIAVKGLVDTETDTAAVPEPATALSLLGLGAVGTVLTARKRRSQDA